MKDPSGAWLTVRCLHCSWGPVCANATRMKKHFETKHLPSPKQVHDIEEPEVKRICLEAKQQSLEKYIDPPFSKALQAKAERKLVFLLTSH